MIEQNLVKVSIVDKVDCLASCSLVLSLLARRIEQTSGQFHQSTLSIFHPLLLPNVVDL